MNRDRIEQIVNAVVEARIREALLTHPEWNVVPPTMFVEIWQTAMMAGIAALAQSIGEPHA